jgi:hypothetical protein
MTTRNKRTLRLLAVLVAVIYLLHQDIWFWRSARPLVLGFVPIGLAYHAAFSVMAAVLLWLLVRYAWPAHLEDADAAADPGAQGAQAAGRDASGPKR